MIGGFWDVNLAKMSKFIVMSNMSFNKIKIQKVDEIEKRKLKHTH